MMIFRNKLKEQQTKLQDKLETDELNYKLSAYSKKNVNDQADTYEDNSDGSDAGSEHTMVFNEELESCSLDTLGSEYGGSQDSNYSMPERESYFFD